MKVRVEFVLFLMLCVMTLSSCTLGEMCDVMHGFHYDASEACVRDTDTECGNGGPGLTPLNCKTVAGVVDGKCVEGECVALSCKEKRYFLEKGSCVPYNMDNCRDGLHFNLDGECVEDTDEECGFDRMNCKKPEWGSAGKCSEGKCSVVGGACLSGYRYNPDSLKCENVDGGICYEEGKILDPDSKECIERCNCEINQQCDRVHACELEWCAVEENICLSKASDFERLRKAMEEGRQIDRVIILNDINLAEREGGQSCDFEWKAIPLLKNAVIMTIGNDWKMISSHVGDKRCTMPEGMFGRLEAVNIYDTIFDLDVKGDKSRGILADTMYYTVLKYSKVMGRIEYTGKQDIIDLNRVCNVEEDEKDIVGVGGIAGKAYYSDISVAFVQLDGVIAKDASYVGGGVGIVCRSSFSNLSVVIKNDVIGKRFVGGIIGKMGAEARVEVTTNEIKGMVKGTTFVGGMIGDASGFIQDIHNEVNEVRGIDINEEKLEDGLGLDDACYDAWLVEGDVGDIIGGVVGNATRTSYFELIRNEVNRVIGCNYVGGSFGAVGGMVSNKNDERNKIHELHTNRVKKVYGNKDVGGYVGSMVEGSLINNVRNETESVVCSEFCGGFMGSSRGRVSSVSSDVDDVRGKFLIGGFAASISGEGIVTDVTNHTKRVFVNGFGGGFMGTNDGIVRKVYNEVDEIRGHRAIGGAFSGAAGAVEYFENMVGKVIGLYCKDIPKQYLSGKTTVSCWWDDCTESERLEKCIREKDIPVLGPLSARQREADLAGIVVGGFLATSDAERNMSYADIINRVEGVYGSESLGGFLGRYGGNARYQVHFDLRNISSYANVYRIGNVEVDYGLKNDFGGFIGNDYSMGDGVREEFFHTHNYENVVSMSHFYQLKRKGENISYDNIKGQDGFEEIHTNTVYGAMRKNLDDNENVETCDVSSIYTKNFFYYDYDVNDNVNVENQHFKAMYDAKKITPISFEKMKKEDYAEGCYLTKLNDPNGYSSRYNLRWCLAKETLGGKDILTLTLRDPLDINDKTNCIDINISSKCVGSVRK